MPYFKRGKKVPSYWWDLAEYPFNAVIVESDRDDLPIVARFPHPKGDASKQIDMAELLIEDLNSGRVTINSCQTITEYTKLKK